jgi:Tol biopolymer transport system component
LIEQHDERHGAAWLTRPCAEISTERGRHGTGISTLETVDVRTGRVRVVLGPWLREFTAGARYAPDGRQVVFERVHKIDSGLEADIDGVTLTVVRLDRSRHRLSALTDPRLYAATADWSPGGDRIVYSALPRPDSPAPDLFLVAPTGGSPVRVTHVADEGGYANEPAWELDSTGILFSGRLDGSAGLPLLLEVRADGSALGSAFGEDLVHGRHPRAQPQP